jgi:tetratricopeptide (TPR) repeat protein
MGKFFSACTIFFVWVSTLFFVWLPDGYAESLHARFIRANTYYENNEFTKALVLYEEIARESELERPELSYNSGNCYFKMNDLGRALAHYKHAAYLSPRDSMIQANLKFTRSIVPLKIDDTRELYMRYLDAFLMYCTASELAILIFIIATCILGSFLCSLLFSRKRFFQLVCGGLFLMLFLACGLLLLKLTVFSGATDAVVVNEDLPVRFAPQAQEKIAFRLAPGIELEIVEEVGEWTKIASRDGESGWVQSEGIVRVFKESEPA